MGDITTLDQVFKVADVAKRYGVKPEVVRSWINSGRLPAVNVCRAGAHKKVWRVLLSGISEFEANRQNQPPKRQTGPRRRDTEEVLELV
jgi:uncharacterized protein YjcR